jgi:hypothetical protein
MRKIDSLSLIFIVFQHSHDSIEVKLQLQLSEDILLCNISHIDKTSVISKEGEWDVGTEILSHQLVPTVSFLKITNLF